MAQFSATLTGAQEVPPVPTIATGAARLSINDAQTALGVLLNVSMITNATVAHIHLGRPGVNGPIVLFLYGPATPMTFGRTAMLTNRTFTATDLTGPLEGMPLSALASEIIAGNAYVNVHTTQHPNGEIRGQIVPS